MIKLTIRAGLFPILSAILPIIALPAILTPPITTRILVALAAEIPSPVTWIII